MGPDQSAGHSFTPTGNLWSDKADIDSYTGMSVGQAVDSLFESPGALPTPPVDPATGNPFVNREELSSGKYHFGGTSRLFETLVHGCHG